jgi:hypothetical protein
MRQTLANKLEVKIMRTITVNLNCQIEERLRKHTGRKGDLSRIANEAFKLWLDKAENVSCVQTKDGVDKP